MIRLGPVAGALALGALLALPAPATRSAPAGEPLAGTAALDFPWDERVSSAARFARSRRGRVSFAIVDDRGRIRGVAKRRRYHSASVVKVMLMVAYLNRLERNDRPLTKSGRALLSPMIRRSDNRTATIIRNIVGNRGLRRVARRAGMRGFSTAVNWGSSLITAADQARFFRRIDRFVGERDRAHALRLLASIVPRQRWGVPPVRPSGFGLYFKGGWRRGSPSGRQVNQVALLERGKVRVSMAILTDANPSHGYGTRTIRGVAGRLLRGLDRAYVREYGSG